MVCEARGVLRLQWLQLLQLQTLLPIQQAQQLVVTPYDQSGYPRKDQAGGRSHGEPRSGKRLRQPSRGYRILEDGRE